MIRIMIERRCPDGAILSFQVKGHAGFAEPGHDIVCAGISAVTVGTVNSVETLTGVVLDSRMEGGFLQASIPRDLEGEPNRQVQLLLESMVVMLHTIEESYGKYIRVQDDQFKKEVDPIC